MKLLAILLSLFISMPAFAGKLTREQIDWCKAQTPPLTKDACKEHWSNPTPPPEVWTPSAPTSFYIQLTGNTSNVNVAVDAYETDLFDSDPIPAGVGIAYFSAGSYEDWRPDEGDFPESVKGRSNGWPGEKWLDIRQLDVLGTIMAKRMDLAVAKGYRAVDPDNVDGYDNRTGFKISYNDQIKYNRMLANLAHERGLAIGLKNNLGQIRDLLPLYQFAVNEECFNYGECDELSPFISADKPVFQIQYNRLYCDQAAELGFYHVRKKKDLNAWRRTCD